MSKSEAEALALFIKDHDTRWQPSVGGEGGESYVQLTGPDGKEQEPIRSVAAYEEEFITSRDPGPSIRAAWEKWRP